MEIRFQVFKDYKLLIQQFIGEFSVETYKQYNQYMRQHYTDEEIRKVLIDFRGVVFTAAPQGFMVILNGIINMRQKMTDAEKDSLSVIRVFWVSKPLPTVIAHIFQKRFEKLNYNYSTTAERVQKELRIDETQLDVEKIIGVLENRFELTEKKN